MRRTARLSIALAVAVLVHAAAAAQPLSPADLERANQHYRKAWDLLRAEAFEDSIAEFQKTIDIDNRYTHAYYGLGKAHMALKQYVQAVQAYERCRMLYEQATSERTNAQYEANDQRRDEILRLRDLLRTYQRQASAAQQGGNNSTQRTMMEIQEQIRQLESIQQRDTVVDLRMRIPAFVSLALGSAYFRSNRMEDAEKMYREAIAAQPDYGEAHNNLAVVCFLTGRLDEAEQHVKLAEKAKFNVPQGLKDDIRAAKKKT